MTWVVRDAVEMTDDAEKPLRTVLVGVTAGLFKLIVVSAA